MGEKEYIYSLGVGREIEGNYTDENSRKCISNV